jgi:monoamine oxidase
MITTMAAASTAAAAATGTKILDLLIIGGGLSGVMVANDFHHRRSSSSPASSPSDDDNNNNETNSKSSWRLLEARSVLGGRLVNDDNGHNIDLGGAWVWPTHQPNLRRLLSQQLDDDIVLFDQPDDPSSTRIDGGAVQIVNSLSKDLPHERILLNTPVTKCSLVSMTTSDDVVVDDDIEDQTCTNTYDDDGGVKTSNDDKKSEAVIKIETSSQNEAVFYARQVVIAVPPRLIAKHIRFDPPLSPEKQDAMESSHTWMAGVTKVSLVYNSKFWNVDVSNMGLPSHLGPAFQVYDASTKDGTISALTFFTITKTESERKLSDKELGNNVASQIASVWQYFGHNDMANQALKFDHVHVQRWPLETYISEDPKPTMIHPHPHPIGALSKPEWNGMLLFAGSEADQRSAGVMEGAIGSAKRVMKDIQS